MHVDGNATSKQSPPVAPARSGSQQGTPSRQTTVSALMDLKEGKHNPPSAFCPINRPSSSVQVSSSPQVTQTPGMTPLGTKITQEMTLCRPTPVHIMDPAVTSHYKCKDNPCVFNRLTLRLVLHPLHRLGWMFLFPLL